MATLGLVMAKYYFGLFNVLIFILSIGAILAGSILFSNNKILGQADFAVPKLFGFSLFAFFILVCLITLLGAYGTFKNSTVILYSYAFIVFILIIVEIVAMVFVFKYKGKIDEVVDLNIKNAFENRLNNASKSAHDEDTVVEVIQKQVEW